MEKQGKVNGGKGKDTGTGSCKMERKTSSWFGRSKPLPYVARRFISWSVGAFWN